MSILHQASNLLQLHGGGCSVPEGSRFANAFRLLEQAGKVIIKPSGTVGYVDVYTLEFKSRFETKEESK